MFDLIKKMLSPDSSPASPASGKKVPRIEVAAGVILVEAAMADGECTGEELTHVIETMQQHFDISREYAQEMVELAREEREHAIELWQFTNEINNHFSREDKFRVMEAVWRIIHSDGQLEKHEDYFARKLSYLLRLSHREMIDTKLRAKESL